MKHTPRVSAGNKTRDRGKINFQLKQAEANVPGRDEDLDNIDAQSQQRRRRAGGISTLQGAAKSVKNHRTDNLITVTWPGLTTRLLISLACFSALAQ